MTKVEVVIFDSDGVKHTATVDSGSLLLDAIESSGVVLPASCGRGCWCSTCSVQILSGGENLTALDDEELQTMLDNGMIPCNPDDPGPTVDISDMAFIEMRSRLSCSCQVIGDVVLREPTR